MKMTKIIINLRGKRTQKPKIYSLVRTWFELVHINKDIFEINKKLSEITYSRCTNKKLRQNEVNDNTSFKEVC